MISKIFLLCVTLAQVSSNPLLQALAQTCPICQQNALKNPLAALSMFLQQPPQNQPYLQGSQFCPCSPNKCHQQPSCLPNNVRSSNNKDNSDILNKLLSNPGLRSILDSNTKLFNQNGPCKNGVPSVINNYIIVSPDLLLDDFKCVPKEDTKMKEVKRGNNGKTGRRPKQNGPTREEQRSKSPSTDVTMDLKPIKENPKSNATQHEGNQPSKLENEDKIQISGSANETERPRERKRRRRKKNRNPNIKLQVVSDNVTETHNKTETPLKETKATGSQILASTTEANILQPTITEQPPDFENIKSELLKYLVKEYMTNVDQSHDNQVIKNMSPVVVSRLNENIETTTVTPEINADPMVEIQIQSPQESNTEKPRKKNLNPNSHTNKVKVNRNSREEAVIADFRQKFPNIPENVVRDLIDHMASKVQNLNLGIPPYYSQYQMNSDELFGNHFKHEVIIPVYLNNKQNKRKNNNKRIIKQKKINNNENTNAFKTTAEVTVVKHDTKALPTFTTTEKPTTLKITTKSTAQIEEITTKPDIVTVTAPAEHVREIGSIKPTTNKPFGELRSIDEIYKTNNDEYKNAYKRDDNFESYYNGEDEISELGTEDIVPIFYVNGLDEYYPDFTLDNQYLSNEDFSYLLPEEDRYYYTTDKNYALQELNRERRRYENRFESNAKGPEGRFVFKINRKNYRDRPIHNVRRRPISKPVITTTMTPKGLEARSVSPKNKVSVEQSTEKARGNEEIQFKTPPSLEKIDFETKPINKNFYFRDDDYKISTYSDFKTPQYIVNDKSPSIGNKPIPVDKIETVYARSKVVKYGQPHSGESFGRFDLANESNLFSTEDKTIVMAKSVPGEFW